MEPLRLSPLPTHRADDTSSQHLMAQESFVDEAVVAAIVTGSHLGRAVADPNDLALAADDLDFAGWRLSKSVTVRTAEVPPQVIDAIIRRGAPARAGESKRGSRHRRWWLTGLAAVLIIPAVVVTLIPGHLGLQSESPLSPEMTTSSGRIPGVAGEWSNGSNERNEVTRIDR